MALSEGNVTDVWGTDNDLDWKGKDPNLQLTFPIPGYRLTTETQLVGNSRKDAIFQNNLLLIHPHSF